MKTNRPPEPTGRMKIINRETAIIAEQLSSALETIHKISKRTANYYLLFYSLSMGLERLIKLIIHIEQPELSPKNQGHRLDSLSEKLEIDFNSQPVVKAFFDFLNSFANGDRYMIVDYLFDGNRDRLNKEPIARFYLDCIQPILEIHPPKAQPSVAGFNDIALVIGTKEDLNGYQSFDDWFHHGHQIAHASKYLCMHVGRMLQPYLERLIFHEGNPLPHFSDFFVYLRGDDNYFRSRRTFR